VAQQITAYELLFRRGPENSASVSDDVAASATVISHVFGELGVAAALGPHRGFINVSDELLLSDAIELLPREQIVLELLETVQLTPLVVARVRELHARGFTLALDDFTATGCLSAATVAAAHTAALRCSSSRAPVAAAE